MSESELSDRELLIDAAREVGWDDERISNMLVGLGHEPLSDGGSARSESSGV